MGRVSDSFSRFVNEWELRILVLVSLLLQILLISLANLRKKLPNPYLQGFLWFLNPLVKGFLWLSYLLADLVATYALGVLSRSQRNSHSDNTLKESQLTAFWAAFLLLHLGGPDPITAFSLEDNQLWLRHGLNLVVQVYLAASILGQYYRQGWIIFPFILVFLSGVLKYGERTWALKRASMEGLRTSMLGDPVPGPETSYATTMNRYGIKLKSGVPGTINIVSDSRTTHIPNVPPPAATEPRPTYAGKEEIICEAYKFFDKFRGLFVDSILSYQDRDDSRPFFLEASAEKAFRVVETELNFAYDMLYTKASVFGSKMGLFIRGFCFASTTTAALIFALLVDNKHGFESVHRRITYALLLGAIALELVSIARLLLSDWMVTWMAPNPRSTWRQLGHTALWSLRLVEWSRWSNMIARYNLVGFCLKDRRRHRWIKKTLCFFGIEETVDSFWYTAHVVVMPELKAFILSDLQERSREAQKRNNYKLFTSCRGEWTLQNNSPYIHPLLGWSITEAEFDESLLIWHIATDLCYHGLPKPTSAENTEDSRHRSETAQHLSDSQYREIAQNLSDYLLYVLVVRPLMLSSTSVVGIKKYMDTCAELTEFLQGEESKLDRLDAIDLLLSVNTDLRPKNLKGDESKSVLWDGCRLAKDLELLEDKRWKIICEVLLEMVCYVAIHCRGYYHAKQLSEGGELLTFTYFLVSHLGMGEQYMIETGKTSANVVDEQIA